MLFQHIGSFTHAVRSHDRRSQKGRGQATQLPG